MLIPMEACASTQSCSCNLTPCGRIRSVWKAAIRLQTRSAFREGPRMDGHARSWMALIALGAFHGVNPAMGWLFAVALGLQEHRRAAVFRALLPLALGHALAIVAVIAIAILAGLPVPPAYIWWAGRGKFFCVCLPFLLREPPPPLGGKGLRVA